MLDDEKSTILNNTWDFYRLLAQQRVTHFNLFIVLSGAILAVVFTNIASSLRGNIISACVAVLHIFMCFIFQKIDSRNKFLIKQTEKTLKNLEASYSDSNYKVMTNEETDTGSLRLAEKNKPILLKQLSTSQLYGLFYLAFTVIGIIAFILSFVFCFVKI
jgi:hypothetical protein